MNLTNTTENLEPAGQVAYKTETASEMLYYQVKPKFVSSLTLQFNGLFCFVV